MPQQRFAMMTLRNAFSNAFKTGLRLWRPAAIVYFLQLCLALTLGMQVHEVLKASIGNSLEINKLLSGYDHSVLTDFLKVHGASITPLVGQLRWLLAVWLVFSVFIDAGLLSCTATPEGASGGRFWQAGATFFFPFLMIALIFLALVLVWTGLIWGPVLLFLEPALEHFSSEKYVVWGLLIALALWLLGLMEFLVWSVLSRLHYLQQEPSVFRSLLAGRRRFQQGRPRFFGLMAGFAGTQLLLLAVYLGLEFHSGMTSAAAVLVFFVVQQAVVFFRIQLRIMLYAGLNAG